ncbi:MAG: hypothetical protein LIO46_00940 [Clostridiales bacterium]|nr:hypothetical protein [Clostridiales bacterium]
MQDWRETSIRRGSPLFLLCFVIIAVVVVSQQPYRWNITRTSGTASSYSDETTTTTALASETQTETLEARPETVPEEFGEEDEEAYILHLFVPVYCQDLRELNAAYHESNGFYYRILHSYEEFFILPFQTLSLLGSGSRSSVYPNDFEEFDAILFYQTGQNHVYYLSAFSYWNGTYTLQVTNAVEDAPYAAAGGLFLFPKDLQADRAEILFEENPFEFYYSTGRAAEQYACESGTALSDEEMKDLGFTRWSNTLYVKRVRPAAGFRARVRG